MTVSASIIIPNRDCPLIGGAIDALGASITRHDIEVLVVGTDREGAIPRGSPILFVQTEHGLSPGAARNRGVEEASGDLFLFTDADCVPAEGWVSEFDTESFSSGGGSGRTSGGSETGPRRCPVPLPTRVKLEPSRFG